MGENQSKPGGGPKGQQRGGGGTPKGGAVPEDKMNAHIKKMDQELRRKLGKGSSYNMKVIIKGDRNTGKTCLLQRLQGMPFKEDYLPSQSIQTANIHWNYRATDDVVKVEVWDVVDKGKQRGKSGSGADVVASSPGGVAYPVADMNTPPGSPQLGTKGGAAPVLDASLIDVYKGSHAAIFIFDITKRWTWDYVKGEIARLNNDDLPILIVSNFLDVADRRVVSQEEVQEFVYSQCDNIRAIECSVFNCFGFKALYSFLNIPFLHLQKQELQLQLERNQMEYDQAVSEFEIITDELDYDYYLKWVEQNKAAAEAKKRKLFSKSPPQQVPVRPRGATAPATSSQLSPSPGEAAASPPNAAVAKIQAEVAAAVAAKQEHRKAIEKIAPTPQHRTATPPVGSPHPQPRAAAAAAPAATPQNIADFKADDDEDVDHWLGSESDVEIAAPQEDPSDDDSETESDSDSDSPPAPSQPAAAPTATAQAAAAPLPAPMASDESGSDDDDFFGDDNDDIDDEAQEAAAADDNDNDNDDDDDGLEGGGLYIDADEEPQDPEEYLSSMVKPTPLAAPAPVAAAPEPTLSPEQLAALEAAFQLPSDQQQPPAQGTPAHTSIGGSGGGDDDGEEGSSRRKHRKSRHKERGGEGGTGKVDQGVSTESIVIVTRHTV